MTTTAHELARLEGYTLNSAGIIQNPGRFQGEHISVLYWYESFLNGEGEETEECSVFYVTPYDRQQCPGIPADAKTARLTHHDSGFLTLSYH